MFRTIIWLLFAAIILIIMLPFGLVFRLIQLIFGKKYDPPSKAAAWICKHIVPSYVHLAGCDYTITGSENLPDEPAVYVGNHQGVLDVVLILFALGYPKIIMAKKEAQYVPIAHLWMTLLKCIFIDRSNIRQSHSCIVKAEDYLKHGLSVLIFPEGTRSRGPHMNEFKHGAFKIAAKANVPIVPFVVDGTYNVFEKQMYLKKSPAKFSILPAITQEDGESIKDFAQRTKGIIECELERLRNE